MVSRFQNYILHTYTHTHTHTHTRTHTHTHTHTHVSYMHTLTHNTHALPPITHHTHTCRQAVVILKR